MHISGIESILIVGCGYRGRRLARRLRARGLRVRGLTRSAEHAAALSAEGIEPFVGDVTQAQSLRGLGEGIDAVYHLMGSMAGAEPALRQLHVDGTRNVLAALELSRIQRYIYESSTAVYGQTDGEWIDESVPTTPAALIGQLRVEAESILQNARRETGMPLIILRPSSLYRPEGVINGKIRAGTYVIASDPDKLMNHVYIDDFLTVLELALERGRPGEAYNVSDDGPKRTADYMNEIADLMGVPRPKVQWSPPTGGCNDLIRLSNKRVSNAKLKTDFDYSFRFPTYKEGLRESARLGWKEDA